MNKSELLNLVANDAVGDALQALNQWATSNGKDRLLGEITQLQGRLNRLENQIRQGITTEENAGVEMARIRTSAVALINEASGSPAASQPPTAGNMETPPILGTGDGGAPTFTGTGNGSVGTGAGAPAVNKIPLGIGIFTLLAAIGLTAAFPCVSNLFIISKTLLAIGVAALAYYLGGALNLNLPQGVTATGTLGVFALVFLLNPASALQGKDCDEKKPVNPTVFVHGKGGRQDMVLRKEGHVLMDVKGGERKSQSINEKGEAYFQNLHLGDTVYLSVDFSEPYKSVHPDSAFVIREDGRIYLEVALQGLDRVFGTVIWQDAPLPGVVVSVGSALSDTTDSGGAYEITIPEAQQRKEQEVKFVKPGFKLLLKKAFPQTREPLNVLMEKAK